MVSNVDCVKCKKNDSILCWQLYFSKNIRIFEASKTTVDTKRSFVESTNVTRLQFLINLTLTFVFWHQLLNDAAQMCMIHTAVSLRLIHSIGIHNKQIDGAENQSIYVFIPNYQQVITTNVFTWFLLFYQIVTRFYNVVKKIRYARTLLRIFHTFL